MKKLTLLVAALLVSAVALAQNAKPFVIPELRQWTGTTGTVPIGENYQVIVDKDFRKELTPVATYFIKDIETMFKLKLTSSNGTKKDKAIFLTLGNPGTDNAEGYSIDINAQSIIVTANKPVGVFWATRTLLQIMEQDDTKRSLPCGKIVDYPAYAMRGFMLDCARKFFPMRFLEQYVKFMSYYKMNTFQIHLNDNGFKQFFNDDWDQTYSAFRMECHTFPELTAKDGHYTKQEFYKLQLLSDSNFVTIIPEIDAPAHTLAFAHLKPELGSKEYGADHLDLSNPETYKFMDALLKEYLKGKNPVFRGPYMHIGTDEYSNKDPKVVEQFRKFTDHYIKYVESFGKKAMIWGALTHAKGTTPVKVDNVLMNCWYNGYAEPDSMMRLGYDVLSVPDGLLYIVPKAGYYYDYLNTKHLYEKWTPANIGNKTFDENNPKIKGGMFAVWNDHVGNGISTRDVHHRVWPAMQTLATKMWDGTHTTIPWEEFDKKRDLLSEAPGVNLLGRARKGTVLAKSFISIAEELPLNEIGYDYRVSFDIKTPTDLERGTILTFNDDAVFYLANPQNGRMGFMRDGYIYYFKYTIPTGVQVNIAIEGTSEETRLYINGALEQKLETTYHTVKNGGQNSKMAMVKTLQFPLAVCGNFTANIRNFKVEKL